MREMTGGGGAVETAGPDSAWLPPWARTFGIFPSVNITTMSTSASLVCLGQRVFIGSFLLSLVRNPGPNWANFFGRLASEGRQAIDLGQSRCPPDVDGVVARTGNQQSAVRREIQCLHGGGVALQRADPFEGFQIPQLHDRVIGTDRERFVVGGKREGPEGARLNGEAGQFPGGGVPELGLAIVATGGQPAAGGRESDCVIGLRTLGERGEQFARADIPQLHP